MDLQDFCLEMQKDDPRYPALIETLNMIFRIRSGELGRILLHEGSFEL